jgi:NAD(P)H-hydrate repair Nnr-like enzyme with NAD(P)H-hydrate epimerase domain
LGGYGRNGWGGWAVARILGSMGHEVTAFSLPDPDAEPQGEAGVNSRAMEAMGIKAAWISPDACPLPDWGAYDLVADAAFGTGLARTLAGQDARALGSIPRKPKDLRVLSVDLQSGVSRPDGKSLGPAPEADLTVALGSYAYKPWHFMEGRTHAQGGAQARGHRPHQPGGGGASRPEASSWTGPRPPRWPPRDRTGATALPRRSLTLSFNSEGKSAAAVTGNWYRAKVLTLHRTARLAAAGRGLTQLAGAQSGERPTRRPGEAERS